MKVNRMALTVLGTNSEPRPMSKSEQMTLLSSLRGKIIPWMPKTRPKLEGIELFSWKADVRTATTADLFSFAGRAMGQLSDYMAEAYAAGTEEERQRLSEHRLFEIRDDSKTSASDQLLRSAIRFLQGKWFKTLDDLPAPRESMSIKHLANLNKLPTAALNDGGYIVRSWSIPMPTNLASKAVYDTLDTVTARDPNLAACPMVTRFALCEGDEKFHKELWFPIVRTVKSRNGLVIHRDIALA